MDDAAYPIRFEGDPVDNYLDKSAGTIQIRVKAGKLNLSHRKLINALHLFAHKHMLERETHSVRFQDLASMVNYNSNDYAYLRDQARELTRMSIEWDILGDEAERKVWGVSSFLAEIEFHSNGMVMYTYPPRIRKLLASQTHRGQISMAAQKLFDSGYSLSLYENCVLHADAKITPKLSVEEWKMLLAVDDNENPTYKEFKNFNRKVIKPSVREINKVSDITIEPAYHRIGRTVTHISFLVERKPQSFLPFDDMDDVSLQDRLIRFGCSEKDALQILETHDPSYIEGNLNYVEATVLERSTKGDPIKNPVGFLRTALKDDYRPKEPEVLKRARQRDEQQKQDAKAKAEAQSRKNQEVNAAVRAKQASTKDRFDALPEGERVDLQESFSAQLKADKSPLLDSYTKSGLRSKMVMAAFLQFLDQHMTSH